MNYKIIFTLSFIGFLICACEEEPTGQQPTDSVPPGKISNVEFINTPGGALITYTPPSDEDLLYIKGIYSRKEGEISESKASIYADTLVVEGFGNTNERQIELVAVDRSRNESEPVSITISPLEPPVNTIAETLNATADFGGISCTWSNDSKAEISVVIEETDSLLDEFVPLETYYSSAKEGRFAVYGLDTIPINIEVSVQDRWENRSPIKPYEITPLYETEFDKTQFSALNLPGDGPHYGAWPMTNIWNDDAGSGYSSEQGDTWPQSLTIDLGVVGRLSRIRVYQRLGSYIFIEGNLRKFEIWGAETLDQTGNWDSWTLLGDFESIKPSGLPFGVLSDEDVALATNGEDFSFLSSNPKVRYIRVRVKETWARGTNFQLMELDILGDNR